MIYVSYKNGYEISANANIIDNILIILHFVLELQVVLGCQLPSLVTIQSYSGVKY